MDKIEKEVLTITDLVEVLRTIATTPSLAIDETVLESISDEKLVELQESIAKTKHAIELENLLYTRYLERTQQLVGRGVGIPDKDNDNKLDSDKKQDDKEVSKKDKKKKNDKKDIEKPLMLTIEQRSEIAARELEIFRNELKKCKEDALKEVDGLKAEIEELELRLAELKKAAFEFKRLIIQQSVNPRTNTIIAEKVIRYYEDKLRYKDSIIEKTRLNNATLKGQKNRLQIQLKQKEEMGDVLHAIDFDQLSIENAQYQAKIEERNVELLHLKTNAGLTVATLNRYKQHLVGLMDECIMVKRDIDMRTDLLKKLINEGRIVEQDKKKLEVMNNQIQSSLEEYQVPTILEYASEKSQQEEYQTAVKIWERKVEIQQMTLKRLNKGANLAGGLKVTETQKTQKKETKLQLTVDHLQL